MDGTLFLILSRSEAGERLARIVIFAFNPAVSLGQTWWARLGALASDQAFQSGPHCDELHRIFDAGQRRGIRVAGEGGWAAALKLHTKHRMRLWYTILGWQ